MRKLSLHQPSYKVTTPFYIIGLNGVALNRAMLDGSLCFTFNIINYGMERKDRI